MDQCKGFNTWLFRLNIRLLNSHLYFRILCGCPEEFVKSVSQSMGLLTNTMHTPLSFRLQICSLKAFTCIIIPPFVTEQGQGVVRDKLLQKGFPLSVSGGSCPPRPPARFEMLPPEERRLSMPETGEKERNCLFKSYTDLE